MSTTRLCNLNCIYCSEGVRSRGVLLHDIVAGETGGVIPDDQIYNEIKVGSTQYTSIVFSSGEPTLNSELPSFIAYAKELGFTRIELVTNGIRISDKKYLESLITKGLTHLVISVNSFHPEISKIVSGNNYDGKKTFTAIQNALSLGCNLVINIVITRHTLISLHHTLSVLLKMGITGVTISYVRYDSFVRKFDGIDRISPNKIPYSELIHYALKHNLGDICKQFEICNFNDVPICVLEKMNITYKAFGQTKPLIYVDETDEIVEKENVGVSRLFLEPCKKCSVKQFCCGIEEKYLKIYGEQTVEKELSPVMEAM